MRTWKTATWVCGAVLCCTVPAAFCQTLSGSLAAGTGLSADAPHGGSGIGSIGASSQVSASASSAMNAEVGASMDAEGASGAAADGGGEAARSDRLNFRIGPSANSAMGLNRPVNGRLGFGLERGLADERSRELKRTEVRLSTRTNVRNETTQAGRRPSGRVLRARNGPTNKHAAATTRQSGASYSKDFPDSTKGTALLSPPDSTASPLDWTPGLNFSFADFAEQSFLKPSLHGGSSVQKRRVAARAETPVSGGIPGNALTSPALSTSVGDSLQVRVPDPLAALQSH